MSYLEKIAEKVGATQESNLAESVELAHAKVAMLDDAYSALSKLAEDYDSPELSEAAEIMGAIVENEAMDVDDTLQKMASMINAGPTVSGLLEKRAEAEFDTELLNECERIALLGDISDFTKTAAEEANDDDLQKVAEVIDEVIVSDLEELDGILKQAGIQTQAFMDWLGANSAKAGDFFKGLYGKTKDIALAKQLRSGSESLLKARSAGAQNIVKGKTKKALKDLIPGAAKTLGLYGAAGVAGYGGYKTLRKKK